MTTHPPSKAFTEQLKEISFRHDQKLSRQANAVCDAYDEADTEFVELDLGPDQRGFIIGDVRL